MGRNLVKFKKFDDVIEGFDEFEGLTNSKV